MGAIAPQFQKLRQKL